MGRSSIPELKSAGKPPSELFTNDGSFLEKFLQMQQGQMGKYIQYVENWIDFWKVGLEM